MDDDMLITKNLVYLYFLLHPTMTAKRIEFQWKRAKIFKEYARPRCEDLTSWVSEFREEVKTILKH
jgi:hypothetical protein